MENSIPRVKKLVLLIIYFLLFPTFLPVAAEVVSEIPQFRTSYWASGGENLLSEKAIIPFIERKALAELLREDRVLFLDIREQGEFEKAHIPDALNIPFSERDDYYSKLKPHSDKVLIPYCNWDFRGYVAGVELKKKGFTKVAVMYPHGLRGWIAEGLPVAGKEKAVSDQDAEQKLRMVLIARQPAQARALSFPHALSGNPESGSPTLSEKNVKFFPKSAPRMSASVKAFGDDAKRETASTSMRTPLRKESEVGARHVSMRILAKRVEPQHIEASIGDRLILDLTSEEEDHWFVIPDFGVNLHLKKGGRKTVTLDITRVGYFPFGCITCCMRYRCQTKQAILVNVKEDLSRYGE